MASKIKRIYTGLAGLPIKEDAVKELSKEYGKVLRALAKLPEESKYRSITEQLIKQRLAIVESTTDRNVIEEKIGGGVCEELIEHAKLELELAHSMKRNKPWEPLVEKPPENQWKWPL